MRDARRVAVLPIHHGTVPLLTGTPSALKALVELTGVQVIYLSRERRPNRVSGSQVARHQKRSMRRLPWPLSGFEWTPFGS